MGGGSRAGGGDTRERERERATEKEMGEGGARESARTTLECEGE